jgi:hypothetical protein
MSPAPGPGPSDRACAVLAALASRYVVERPFLRSKQRFEA